MDAMEKQVTYTTEQERWQDTQVLMARDIVKLSAQRDELLAACEEALEFIEDAHLYIENMTMVGEAGWTCANLQEAIKKAKGESA